MKPGWQMRNVLAFLYEDLDKIGAKMSSPTDSLGTV
jgi:hypothetical protein